MSYSLAAERHDDVQPENHNLLVHLHCISFDFLGIFTSDIRGTGIRGSKFVTNLLQPFCDAV